MCVVLCFRWQCVLLGLLVGKVSFCMLYVTKYVVGSFRWQCVLWYVLGGNVCC